MTVDFAAPTLVTGAAGFVGNNLVRQLLKLGRRVRVLVRQPDNASLVGLAVETSIGDVLVPNSLEAAMEGASSVFHLAGSISIDGKSNAEMKRVNIEGTANVVNSCLKTNVARLVHFSSIHALSYLPKDEQIDENRRLATDPQQHLVYDQSKAAAELHVLEGVKSGLDAVILNPVGIFGPYDYGPSAGGEFLEQLMHRKLPGLVRAGYHWVDVRDVALAAIAAEARGRTGERYILTGEYADFKTIARWVHAECGASPPLLNVPLWLARQTAPIVVWYSRLLGRRPLVTPEAIEIVDCHQNIATNKAASEFNFQTRPLQQTITDTVCWLQNHNSN